MVQQSDEFNTGSIKVGGKVGNPICQHFTPYVSGIHMRRHVILDWFDSRLKTITMLNAHLGTSLAFFFLENSPPPQITLHDFGEKDILCQFSNDVAILF